MSRSVLDYLALVARVNRISKEAAQYMLEVAPRKSDFAYCNSLKGCLCG